MGSIITDCQKEGVGGWFLELLDRPIRDLGISKIMIGHVKGAPVKRFPIPQGWFPVGRHSVQRQYHPIPLPVRCDMSRVGGPFGWKFVGQILHRSFVERAPSLIDGEVLIKGFLATRVEQFSGAECLIA